MSPDPSTRIERILIVRPSAMGDVARTVPCLVSLRRAWPEAEIDWLVNAGLEPVIAHHPALHRPIAFERRELTGAGLRPSATRALRQLVERLRDRRYDLAIDLQGLFRSALFTGLCGSPRRVGLANAREMGWVFYNERHRLPRSMHTVDRMLGLLDAARIPPVADLTLHVPPPARHEWKSRWAEIAGAGSASDAPYVLIAPTAAWRCKQWPMASYQALAERIMRAHPGLHVVVPLAHNEPEGLRESWSAWARAWNRRTAHASAPPGPDRMPAGPATGSSSTPGQEPGRAYVVFTSIALLMAAIARCRLFIGNDSGPLHLAVGLSRPTVSLFGPTDPRLVGPYPWGESHVVLQPPGLTPRQQRSYRRRPHDQSLIARIHLDSVWQRVSPLLSPAVATPVEPAPSPPASGPARPTTP